MTTPRFFTIKNLKVFVISICVQVVTIWPSSEFNFALLRTLALQEKLEPQISSLSSHSFKTHSLANYSLPSEPSKLYPFEQRNSPRNSASQVRNLGFLSNSESLQESDDSEVDHQKQLHETIPNNEQTEMTGEEYTDPSMNSPYWQLDSNLEEGDYLDANKINESRLTTRAVNVKTIETAIFADRALDQKFNGRGGLIELNKLILTIMNQVQLIFSFRSMKTPIKINIVRIEHMKDIPDPPSTENGDIDGYLSSFCKWQYNMLLRDKNVAWDHAILLTGLDLYKSTPNRNHSGVLGLAWVGGMCKLNYSCTINEALSLESAFVIAHEMGHSLGILHDGQQNNCDRNNYIMSERTGAGKVHWSTCSNYYLSDSIRKKQLFCLDGERNPVMDIYNLSKMKPPGQVYTINDQCKLAFGNNYTAFVTRENPFNSVCRELWCVAGTWAKAAHPALEGSVCGDTNKFCNQGDCKQYA